MIDTADLEALKVSLNEAIKTSKRLDRCHLNYQKRIQSGFSRAVTTTYNSNAYSLSNSLKSELETVKETAVKVFNLE